MNQGRKKPPLAILVAVTALGALALNILLPSLPSLARAFDTDYGTVQLALSLYLVGVAFGQLVYGPVSDRYGRRPAMLIGLGLFLIGSVVCLMAPTIELLIVGRLIQAIGSCAGMVLARAIIRDLYERDRAASMLAYVTMAMVVAPMVAPTMGGFLDVWFGWWAGFAVVLVAGAVVFVSALAVLHETHNPQDVPLSLVGMIVGFGHILRVPAFHGYGLQLAFSTAAFFAFLGGAPYVTMELLHYSPRGYGLAFMMISTLYMVGNFATARFSARVGIDRMIAIGVTVAVIGAGAQAILYVNGVVTLLSLFGSMAFIAFGNGLAIPNGIAGAVSVHPQLVGAASGLVGFLQMGTGALASYLVGLSLVADAGPMVWFMLGSAVLALLAHFIGNGRPKRRAAA